MQTLFDVVPSLADYRPTLWVIVLLALVTISQNFLTAPFSFIKNEQVPGMPLNFDHSNLSFRVLRTFQNSAEIHPAFMAPALVAVVVGAPVLATNISAGIYLAARLAYWAIYYAGVGKVTGGPRTMAFVVGLLANIVMIGLAISALI